MLAVVVLQRGFEEVLLGSEFGVHALSVDSELSHEFAGAGAVEALSTEQLHRPVEEVYSVVLLWSTHKLSDSSLDT